MVHSVGLTLEGTEGGRRGASVCIFLHKVCGLVYFTWVPSHSARKHYNDVFSDKATEAQRGRSRVQKPLESFVNFCSEAKVCPAFITPHVPLQKTIILM